MHNQHTNMNVLRESKETIMTRKLTMLALALVLVFTSVLAPFSSAFTPVASAKPASDLLTNIPVVGPLADGGTFEGTLSVIELAFENGSLLVSGVLEGTATSAAGVVTEITQTFTDVPASLLAERRCDILFLDLGPIFLDLLGLQVDLSRIILDIDAVAGAGNLLGNLLCAVAGLLDGDGPLSRILRLLDRINTILG
jgi:hypothetical protein